MMSSLCLHLFFSDKSDSGTMEDMETSVNKVSYGNFLNCVSFADPHVD